MLMLCIIIVVGIVVALAAIILFLFCISHLACLLYILTDGNEKLERYFREPFIDKKSGNPYDWLKHQPFHWTLLSVLLCGERKSVQHHRHIIQNEKQQTQFE